MWPSQPSMPPSASHEDEGVKGLALSLSVYNYCKHRRAIAKEAGVKTRVQKKDFAEWV